MSEAPLRVDWLTFWIIFATAVFLVWSIAAAVEGSAKRRSKAPPEKGELAGSAPVTDEKHRPGAVIDVFNKNIEEGEGRLPLLAWIVLIGVPIWWLSYLIIYWNQH